MQRKIAPGVILVGALFVALGLAGLSVWVAMAQPWLGIDLKAQDQGAAVIIAGTAQGSPMQDMRGARLIAIGPQGGASIALEPDDLVEEPDTLGKAAQVRRFFDRQAQIDAAMVGGQVAVLLGRDGAQQTVMVTPASSRPLGDLPFNFWSQLFVGVVGLSLGAWVVTLRPKDAAAWMLLLSGVGLALSAQAAAIYSTRELALGPATFVAASRVNGFGTLLFGIGMVTLFLIYPKRLVRGAALGFPALVIGLMLAVVLGLDWPQYVPLLPVFVSATMAVLLIAIAAQVWTNWRDLAARAMMGWLGLSVALGAGGFVVTVIVPPLLGRDAVLEQSTAFLFFLLIYTGIALGVARYRLFDLADWSLGVLFYAVGVALLLMLDALLIFGLALDRLPALSLSLAVVCLIYLPLRRRLSGWVQRDTALPIEDLYRQITDIAHLPEAGQQLAATTALWDEMFRPLSILPRADVADAPSLAEDGRTLFLPGVAGLPGLRLDYADRGARLFSSRDARRAATISHLLGDALTRHRSYTQAVLVERLRINRDMHDNIGILLLSALHTPEADRKNTLIRQTLADLREIVSNPMHEPWLLSDLLADLRAEVAEVLEAAGLALHWETAGTSGVTVPAPLVQTLRAFVREGVANVVRHSGGRRASVMVRVADGQLRVALSDDGSGFDPIAAAEGNGLANLRTRMLQCDGALSVETAPSGTIIATSIPLEAIPGKAAE
ncbi:hypothetical protein [Roseicitreum antarcticum]|uniref:Signal transduction histidine kinase n=1 Tax=Roseicitreum antarcticum TaxID=564137 RepID=A0A1H2VDH2_9RHOB|nr:hypothetical protein [Roseicitreum antarcticum]SDW66388.1 Signal transduction histidine kinase [Roseicitreum antarcticum]